MITQANEPIVPLLVLFLVDVLCCVLTDESLPGLIQCTQGKTEMRL
jgi:hypothetical protein